MHSTLIGRSSDKAAKRMRLEPSDLYLSVEARWYDLQCRSRVDKSSHQRLRSSSTGTAQSSVRGSLPSPLESHGWPVSDWNLSGSVVAREASVATSTSASEEEVREPTEQPALSGGGGDQWRRRRMPRGSAGSSGDGGAISPPPPPPPPPVAGADSRGEFLSSPTERGATFSSESITDSTCFSCNRSTQTPSDVYTSAGPTQCTGGTFSGIQ